jgi:type IV pilus assembly protein PilC
MPSYEWKGRDRNGATQTGVLIGDSKDAVIAALRRQQIVVTTVKEKGKEIALPKFGGGVNSKDIAVFTRQFSVMIDAGLPLVQCLDILGQQQDNKIFQKIILQVRQDVEGGSSLAEAMRKHPPAFDDLYVNMVAAGEAGGILDTILQRLAAYIEKAVKLKSQVKSALVYPVSVITIAVIVVYVILWKVIPVFAALFEGLGGQLPFLTQIVVNLSKFIGNFWWLIIVIVVGGLFALRQYYQTDVSDRQAAPEDTGDRNSFAQDRGGTFLSDARYAAQLRCGDPRVARNHRPDRW